MTTLDARRPVRTSQAPGPEPSHDSMYSFDPLELLTPDEVCALLKMKRTWFYAEVARGALQPLKLGRSTRVRRCDLEAYLTAVQRAS